MPLKITPVILSFDEAPNIERLLSRLHWARTVVVVDSGSSDGTQALARSFKNVQLLERAFDSFEGQWTFAIGEAQKFSPWILALDADYVPSERFIESVMNISESSEIAAYRASFTYCICGRPLRGSLYPPKLVLFHAKRAYFTQRGHTVTLNVDGAEANLTGNIFHDDRKPRSRWLCSQWRYACEEAQLIDGTSWTELKYSARVRSLLFLAAPAAFVMTLFVRGAVFDGRSGIIYALERAVAELLITIALIERRLNPRSK